MATYNDGLGYNLNSAAHPAHTMKRVAVHEIVFKLADIVAARAAANLPALADGDILELLPLPAQSLVLAAGLAIEEASEDAGLTAAVGDAADPDGFVAAQAADAVGDFCSIGGATPYVAGKYYSASEALGVLLAGAVPTTGTIRVWAVVFDGAGDYPLGLVEEAKL